jgi:hypothetical protein
MDGRETACGGATADSSDADGRKMKSRVLESLVDTCENG